jgi:hypothetical protein
MIRASILSVALVFTAGLSLGLGAGTHMVATPTFAQPPAAHPPVAPALVDLPADTPVAAVAE